MRSLIKAFSIKILGARFALNTKQPEQLCSTKKVINFYLVEDCHFSLAMATLLLKYFKDGLGYYSFSVLTGLCDNTITEVNTYIDVEIFQILLILSYNCYCSILTLFIDITFANGSQVDKGGGGGGAPPFGG